MSSRPRSTLALLASLAVLALGASACNEDTPVDPTAMAKITRAAGDSQTVKVGSPSAPLEVLVTSVNGNPLPNAKVYWIVGEGGGKLADTVSTSDASGKARMTYTAGTLVDTATVQAVNGFIEPAAFTIFQIPEAASRLTPVNGNGAAIGPGKALQLVTRVTDKFGNPIKGVTVTWSASTGSLSVTSVASDSTGKAGTVYTLPSAPGDYVATASAPNIASLPFTVHAVPTAR